MGTAADFFNLIFLIAIINQRPLYRIYGEERVGPGTLRGSIVRGVLEADGPEPEPTGLANRCSPAPY